MVVFVLGCLPVEERIQTEIQHQLKLVEVEKMNPLVRTKILLKIYNSSWKLGPPEAALENRPLEFENSNREKTNLLNSRENVFSDTMATNFGGSEESEFEDGASFEAPKDYSFCPPDNQVSSFHRNSEVAHSRRESSSLNRVSTPFLEEDRGLLDIKELDSQISQSQVTERETPSAFIAAKATENSCRNIDMFDEVSPCRKRLSAAIDSDSNLAKFKTQLLDSGITIDEILEKPDTELKEFMMEYLKLASFSAEKAVAALKRRVRLTPRTK